METKMINVLVNSTTFANGISGAYDFGKEGNSLKDLRVTPARPITECIYRRDLDMQKVTNLVAGNNLEKAQAQIAAIDKECVRVGSLACLLEELKNIESSGIADDYDIILCYVPTLLRKEIETGRVKFYIYGKSVSSYYSDVELILWDELLPIISKLFTKLVFKDILSCKQNRVASQNESAEDGTVTAQDLRVAIYQRQYAVMTKKFAEEKRKFNAAKNTKIAVNDDEF